MGGVSKIQPDPIPGTVQQQVLRPADIQNINALQAQTRLTLGSANQGAQTAAGQVQSNFGQFNPNLQTNFQYNPELDAYSQQQVSAGRQAIAQGQGARDARIAQQFAGRNPGLAGILQSQNRFQSANAGNSLGFAAATGQQGRELSQFQNTNAARLAQSQQASNLQQLANAALGQQAQLSQQPFANTQSALQGAAATGGLLGQSTNFSLADLAKMRPPSYGNYQPRPAPVTAARPSPPSLQFDPWAFGR
jgi:hypothetical protein